jgi:hypothetical protein
MHIYHIVLVFIEFERELTASFVSHDTAHSSGDSALRKIFQVLGMICFDEANKKHFPKAYLTYGQKVKLRKIVGKVHYDCLAFGHLSLLTAYQD